MKRNVYVMIDTVTGNPGDVFSMENDATVIRSMKHTLSSVKKTNPYAYNMMRDANILCIGVFDSESVPMIDPIYPARFVGSGASLISSDESMGDE